jgi:hypothetical protein
MPRINQLPVASSVAQTDVLAIDTPDKTYQVPRSVLAPSPYIATIPTGQWSGSGSDYYITVTASNVTADSILYPFFGSASEELLNGPVWAVPAAGSFTIHTSAIPSDTVTISVLLAGVVGEAQYQVLADVYSTSQVDSIVAQSTAIYTGVATVNSGKPYQLTAQMLSAKALVIILRRYGYAAEVIVSVNDITIGVLTGGIKTYFNSTWITLSFSTTGLMTVTPQTTIDDLNLDVIAFN